ncbi:CoA-binding protein [Desulfocarbo indianensis]|nr:CoA-binding protein [Desulfocarbo indianensis]
MLKSLDRPDDQVLLDLFKRIKTIAVVGLSADPQRDSHMVAAYLQRAGYAIIPVNPKESSILGESCHPDLESIPQPVDLVDVFRQPRFVPGIAEQAVAIKAKALWLQLGVRHDQAARMARQAGLLVVQNLCLKVEHARLLGRLA